MAVNGVDQVEDSWLTIVHQLVNVIRPHAICNFTVVENDAKLNMQDTDFLITGHLHNTERIIQIL